MYSVLFVTLSHQVQSSLFSGVMQSCASASTINFSPWAYFFKLYIHNNYLLQGIAYHQQGFHQNLIFASLGSVK